jgi:hypothetical protein
MSAVELWKAQQTLLSERPSADFSKWRSVGNGENAALDHDPKSSIKLFSVTLNRISASSPNTDAQDGTCEFRRRNALEPSRHKPDALGDPVKK